MASQAVAFLQQAGYLALLDAPLWNTGALLPDASIAGRVAHALVGYTEQPDGMQLMAWTATILAARLLSRPAPGLSSGPRPAAARR